MAAGRVIGMALAQSGVVVTAWHNMVLVVPIADPCAGGMKPNRSIPAATVIPVLIYPDVREASPGSLKPSTSSSGCGSGEPPRSARLRR
jgi:hypothetical protein